MSSLNNFDLSFEYHESDYSIPGAILWDFSDTYPELNSSPRQTPYLSSALLNNQPTKFAPTLDIGLNNQALSQSNWDRDTTKPHMSLASRTYLINAQECIPHICEQQTDSHINNAALGWFLPPTFLAVEDSAIHTPDLDIPSKFKNSAEDILLQSTEPFFSEASSGPSVSGVSRSSTPALSFASSRSSSRSPPTKLHHGPCLCNEDSGIESFNCLAELNGTPSEASTTFANAGSITTVGNDNASWDSPVGHPISGMYPNYSPPYPEFGMSYPSPPSKSSEAAPLHESNECFDDGHLNNKETLAPPPSPPLRRLKRKVRSHRREDSDDEYEEPEDTGDDETYDPASSAGHGNLTTGKKRKAASNETTEERTCKKCGLVFTRSADIGRHCASAHSEMSEEMKQECTCVLCLKRLARPDAMKRHLEARTKKCLLEAKRRKERGELDPVIYRLHLQSSC
ncbi:hypothetical protein HHX47_DHR7000314 [Lentinula edodes]|nr:hypothetical protein HHX47_DHR7000314 [Lentinula edodes]